MHIYVYVYIYMYIYLFIYLHVYNMYIYIYIEMYFLVVGNFVIMERGLLSDGEIWEFFKDLRRDDQCQCEAY